MFHSIYVSILDRFWDVARHWSKIADLNISHLYLAPVRLNPSEFRRDLWRWITRVLGYRMALFMWSCVWHIAGLWQTDGQTDRQRQTNGQTTTAYTALAQHRAVIKNQLTAWREKLITKHRVIESYVPITMSWKSCLDCTFDGVKHEYWPPSWKWTGWIVSEQTAGLDDVQLTLNLPVELYLGASLAPLYRITSFPRKPKYCHLMTPAVFSSHSRVTVELTLVAIASPASNHTATTQWRTVDDR